MIIWLALLIPLLGIGIMLKWFPSTLVWWEILLPLATCIVFIAIFKLIAESSDTSDTEYWGGTVQSAQYYESWETWVQETCSYTTCTGSGKDEVCVTHHYDCSYCDDNGPEYTVTNDIGETYYITESLYKQLKARWKAVPQFVELGRRIDYDGGCGKDGDMYRVDWDKIPLTSENTVSKHSYKNKIQAAHSAFDFPTVTEEDKKLYKLFDYPKVNVYKQNAILGADSVKWMLKTEIAKNEIMGEYFNGKWGPKVHGKTWFLIFVDMPLQSALMQEAYWDGANDNELVICIGLSSSSRSLQWVKAFSWTSNRKILVDLREDIMNLRTYDFNRIYEVADVNMKSFKRRDFEEFNYLSVEPKGWQIIVTYIVSLLMTIGICYWAAKNEFVADKDSPWKTYIKY